MVQSYLLTSFEYRNPNHIFVLQNSKCVFTGGAKESRKKEKLVDVLDFLV
jgi:hypothetical protein